MCIRDSKIEKGEMVAITGASGSGKSTLMHILGCLDRVDDGTYLLEGQDVSKLSKNDLARIRNRKIGFVFQTFNLLPRMRSLENVELPLLYAGENEAKERAKKALSTVGLEDRMYHEPSQLSGGQRQRVAIARAIVTEPAIILADEPTGDLDINTAEKIKNLLFHIVRKFNHTLLVVTHNPSVVSDTDVTYRLDAGSLNILLDNFN